jgi:hypothetical protein
MGCHSDNRSALTSGHGVGVGSARGSRRSTTTRAWAGTRRVADHSDLADREEGGDPFGLGLQIRHLAAGRDPDPELLAGPRQAAASDPWDAVVGGGQLGMAAGQRPPPPQTGAEQGAGQRLPSPGNHRHQEGGGHDQPLRALAAEALPQPEVGGRDNGDQRQFESVGSGRPEDAVEQPVGRPLPHYRSGHDGRGLVQGAQPTGWRQVGGR